MKDSLYNVFCLILIYSRIIEEFLFPTCSLISWKWIVWVFGDQKQLLEVNTKIGLQPQHIPRDIALTEKREKENI